MARETVDAYIKRVNREASLGQTSSVPGHDGDVQKDWGKAFRSRPASDDYAATCSCGWRASAWSHSATEGWAKFWRHVKSFKNP